MVGLRQRRQRRGGRLHRALLAGIQPHKEQAVRLCRGVAGGAGAGAGAGGGQRRARLALRQLHQTAGAVELKPVVGAFQAACGRVDAALCEGRKGVGRAPGC